MRHCLQNILFTSRCHPHALPIKWVANHFSVQWFKASEGLISWDNGFLKVLKAYLPIVSIQSPALQYLPSTTGIFKRYASSRLSSLMVSGIMTLSYLSNWFKTNWNISTVLSHNVALGLKLSGEESYSHNTGHIIQMPHTKSCSPQWKEQTMQGITNKLSMVWSRAPLER